jgi:hypothetical protein
MGLSTAGRFVELSAGDLVGLPVGDSSQQILDAVNRAGGGVLLITQTDRLTSREAADKSSREAVLTLTRVLAGNQDDVVVVLAGEPVGMTSFLADNRSLTTLFHPPMKFLPYRADELVMIFQQLARSAGHRVGEDVVPMLHKQFEQLRRGDRFDNGRYLRRLLDQAHARQAARLRTIAAPSLPDLELLSAGDVAGALAGLDGQVVGGVGVPDGADESGRRAGAFRRLAATVQNHR